MKIPHIPRPLTAIIFGMAIGTGSVHADTVLKVSHQWSTSDVRHKVAQMVADEVAAANVGLELKIYPSKSLFKPKEQYNPLSRGQLDMTVVPLAYAAGQQPAYNLTLMPGLVKNHDHAARLVESPFMAKLEEVMATDDVMVLVHGYLAGGFAGKEKCITKPDDVKGLKIRAAGKSFEQMVAAAGQSDRLFDVFDPEGRLREDEREKVTRLSMELVEPLSGDQSDTVINARHKFARKRFDREYRWTPTEEIGAAIYTAIFGKT